MTRIKSKRTNYPNESLSIQKVENGTLPGTIFISSSSSSDYSSGYFDKADLARALIEVGFTPEDLVPPKREAADVVEALPAGAIFDRYEAGDKDHVLRFTRFSKTAHGKYLRIASGGRGKSTDNDIAGPYDLNIVVAFGTEDRIVVQYPKED